MDQDNTPALPSYLTAADNHNLGNQGNSWFSLEGIGESISNMPEFMAVSALSGLNSFYNTGVKVGNFLGGNFEEQKTSALIAGIDNDLGAYYNKNSDAADLMGFVIGSILPGVAGIKILNAGQKALIAANEGIVGTNLGAALGLRATKIDYYIRAAATEITQGQAMFATLGSNGTKALASGIYQNVLEGIAFETAVQATMQASPVLDGQSKSDVLWNVALGGLLGGVIGGAFKSAESYGTLKKLVTSIRQETQEVGSRTLQQELNSPANRVIRDAYDLEQGPALDPGDPLYAQKVQSLAQRQSRIQLAMRSNAGELVIGDDVTLRRLVADINVGSPADDILGRMLHTDEITRLNVDTAVEKAIKTRQADGAIPDSNLQVHYWRTVGEDAGTVLDHAPVVTNIADTIRETSRQTSREGVLQYVRDQKFSVKNLWDARSASLGAQGHKLAEARYIWASMLTELPEKGVAIHMNDIPLLQAAQRLRRLDIQVVNSENKVLKEGFTSFDELERFTIAAQEKVAVALQKSALKSGTPFEVGENLAEAGAWVNHKISKITNIRVGALEGTSLGSKALDYDAMAAAQLQHDKFLTARGLRKIDGEENDVRFLPSWAKVTKRVDPDMPVDGNVLDALTYLHTKEQLAKEAMDRVVAKQAGEFYEQLPEVSKQDLANSSPLGTGAGAVTFSNPGYNDLGTKFALVGSVVQRMAQKFKRAFSEASAGELSNLGRNQEAVIEWGALHQKTSRSAKQWYVHEGELTEGSRGLLAKEAIDPATGELSAKYAGYTLEDLTQEGLHIPIVRNETWELTKRHRDLTRQRTVAKSERAAAAGKELSMDAEVFRPIPPNPSEYKFFAFVKDPKVTGQGHTSMIFAEDEQRLEALVKKAQQSRPDLEVYFKRDTEEFQRARGQYEYDRTLSENYIDSSLKNEGIYSDYFIKTDPQKVLDEFVNHHARAIDIDVREVVRAKYQAPFDWLEDQASAYSRVSTSRFGGNFSKLEQEGKNPYLSYIKTALNLSRVNENPLWYSFNKTLDEAVSKAVGKFNELWGSAKSVPTDEELTALNAHLQKYGLNTGYYDAATALLVNHTAPQNVLSKFIRGANAVLSRITLGLDPLNALNNVIGANILRGTELRQILDAIKAGDKDLAGELAKLGKIDVTGQGDLIMSPAKLIASSMKRYTRLLTATAEDLAKPEYAELAALREQYKSAGFIRDITDQFGSIVNDFSLTGTEAPSVLVTRLQSAIERSKTLAEAGEKWTGNKVAEEMNRFISADVMKQITDLAVKRGLMDTKEQLAYINTFVNRVEGNVIASQRPFIFQGPVGQAIGLFQSYQFNLMQQMFRYVSEGSKKDAAMLLGLQGTFYGIQGLPAFQAINQHIIGNASGNTRHVDAYDAIYGVAGKNLGDLLTYGLPSNLLQTNLYSRGDINPRQVTIIPTALNEVPIVGAFSKFFGSLKETAQKIGAGGAVWESLLQGIEHNGISRPLAGLAQTLQVTAVGTPMSTSSKGDILFTNDLVSLATLTRLAGGRPLDEAIVNDGVFRIHSYQAKDRAKQLLLAEAVKTQAQVGADMDWGAFAERYAAAGGKQINFNRFMVHQIKSAGVSQSEKIVQQLQNPFAQKVQLLMGE